MSFHQKIKIGSRSGFTIIELLLVVGILVVLGTILVPTVRLLNADRRIRESARMVNMFASSVRDEAIVDGESAFMMVRNANVPDRCYELRRMRILPPFAGNTIGEGVEVVSYLQMSTGNTYYYIDIDLPFGNPDLTGINIGDSIKINYRNVSYRIADIDDAYLSVGFGAEGSPGRIRLTLDFVLTSAGATVSTAMSPVPLSQPIPPVLPGVNLPFQIARRPVVINSGNQRLPGSQFIDLSKSGPVDGVGAFNGGDTYFSERDNPLYIPGGINYPTPLRYQDGYGSVVVVFDNAGAVDRFYVRFGTPDEAVFFPGESIFLLVATDRDDEVPNLNNLNNLDNLWVTIGRNNGAVYTGEIAQTDPANNNLVRINNSRSIARKRLQELQ